MQAWESRTGLGTPGRQGDHARVAGYRAVRAQKVFRFACLGTPGWPGWSVQGGQGGQGDWGGHAMMATYVCRRYSDMLAWERQGGQGGQGSHARVCQGGRLATYCAVHAQKVFRFARLGAPSFTVGVIVAPWYLVVIFTLVFFSAQSAAEGMQK